MPIPLMYVFKLPSIRRYSYNYKKELVKKKTCLNLIRSSLELFHCNVNI